MARRAAATRLHRQLGRTREPHPAIDAFASPQPNPSHLISASEDFTAVPGSLPPARSHSSRSHQRRGGRTCRLSPMPSARRPSVTFKLTHNRRVPASNSYRSPPERSAVGTTRVDLFDDVVYPMLKESGDSSDLGFERPAG